MTDSRPPLRDPELPSGERADDLLYRTAPGERLPLPHQYAPGPPRPGAASFRTGLPPLTVRSDPAEADVCALTDGSRGVRVLGGRRWPVADDGFVRAPVDEPDGWAVQETCTRVGHDGASLLLHTEMGGYVSVAADGVKVAARGDLFEIGYAEHGEQAVPRAAAAADAVPVVVGNALQGNVRETKGRTTLALPAHRLRRAARAADPRPVRAQVSSCLYAVPDADAALLWAAHGGRPTGTALARVPAGDMSRAGRLSQARYAHGEDPPDLFDHDVTGSRPTRLYANGVPHHSLGHGLGHASSLCPGPTAARESAPLPAAPTVTTTGPVAAAEVARLSARAAEACPVARPPRQHVGRHRARPAPGAARCVEADVPAAAEPGLWVVARDHLTVRAGTYAILAGSSSEDARLIRAVRVDGAPPAPPAPGQGRGARAPPRRQPRPPPSAAGGSARGRGGGHTPRP
uniref:glycoside hydrolase family 3 C-terminal domain-containing protein n=1 Tax=Streptomyces sp. CC224B TaxID=3044571 RepID=UPI0024A91FCA